MIKQNPFGNKANGKANGKLSTRNVGTIRKAQLITSFGIGSIVDFVDDTVIICGTDDWKVEESQKIYHRGLQSLTNKKYFVSPKVGNNYSNFIKSHDIPSYTFPKNLYCSVCKRIFYADALNGSKKCPMCRNSKLTASRFVLVCERGHVNDFPYSIWVHKGEPCESGVKYPTTKMYNVNDKIGIENTIIQCTECSMTRRISPAFGQYALTGQKIFCNGDYVHLNRHSEQPCDCIPQLKLRSTSSMYFPCVVSALSIPPYSDILISTIDSMYNETLSKLDESTAVSVVKCKVSNATNEQILKVLRQVKESHNISYKTTQENLYLEEYEALSHSSSNDDGMEFSSTLVEVPEKYTKQIESVTAVDILTETMVLCGFTRLKPPTSMYDPNLVPLSSKPLEYLPAVKLFGEGIFIKFRESTILEWSKRISTRYTPMKKSLNKSFMENEKFSPVYVLLHTFAHLFIRQISSECGYSTASLKEKIYSTFNGIEGEVSTHPKMYGVLVYLSSSDSDGSLGGLVSIAKDTLRLESTITNTIDSARWCSSDPICINSKSQGIENLNFASCYSCTLLPETSCETGNILLDSYSIIGNPTQHDGFFEL